MSATCPKGHQSATTDYCDRCGAPIGAATPPVAPAPPMPPAPPVPPAPPPRNATAVLPAVGEVDTSPVAPAEPCPRCGADRSGDDRYCEGCGHDLLAPPTAPGVTEAAPAAEWEAVAAADRRQFDRVAPEGLAFPEHYRERRFTLRGGALRIGRSRGRPGETVPEIDLSGESEDPGVSHWHAVLERREDGGYTLRDLGSTNGTLVNDDLHPLDPDGAVPLSEGDRIRLGAWTTITLRRAR